MDDKVYLGDGVYARMTEIGSIHLTSEDGINVLDRIVLETEVYRALLLWRDECIRRRIDS